jgi:hypothetical protein
MSETQTPPVPTSAEVEANNASAAPSGDVPGWVAQLQNLLASVESRVTQVENTVGALAPLLPVIETVVAAAAPEVAAPVAAGIAAASGVAGVVDDLLTSLNQHFGAKLAGQIKLPAAGAASAASSQ